ncbi:MAG: molybdopterin oxidoreductase family protein [Candidatus Brocadiales bacterium]
MPSNTPEHDTRIGVKEASDKKLFRCVCPLDCPDTCSIIAHVKDGKLVKIEGDRNHPTTRGFLCPKMTRNYPGRVYSPDRLLYPMKRTGPKGSGDFKRIGWDEAVDTIASHFKKIISEDGPEAILPFYGSGTLGIVHGKLAGKRFFNRLGTLQLDRTICTKAGRMGYLYTMGSSEGADPGGIPQSRLIISWGTNTFATNLHQLPLLSEARRRGARYVVINPFRVKGAEVADIFIQPRPGSDAALALGMMHVIIREELYDKDFVDKNTFGFGMLCQRVEEYPPEKVEKLTDIESETIIELARLYAQEVPSFIYAGSGMQHHTNGGMTVRTIACLPALVGAWGHIGGGMFFPTSTVFPVSWDKLEGNELRPSPPSCFNMNRLGAMLTNNKPQIRALYVFNANPLAVLFNQNKLTMGLERQDLFTVVHEQFLTDTARYADVVLPATTQFEQVDLHASYFHLNIQLNRQAIAPVGECRSNLDTFNVLARALGFTDKCFNQSSWDVIEEVLSINHPALEGITLDRLKEEGYAPVNMPNTPLGQPYAPFRDGVFHNPSGKIEFYSNRMKEDGYDPLPAYTAPGEGPECTPELYERYPLYFITPSAHSLLNSNLATGPHAQEAEKRPTLILHPKDAATRGINTGDKARVFNDRGSCTLWALVAEKVRPGVAVSLGQWWSSRSPDGANTNHTTPDYLADMGGGSAFNTNLVQVEKIT